LRDLQLNTAADFKTGLAHQYWTVGKDRGNNLLHKPRWRFAIAN
jgi:hypothetical protein